MNLNFLFSNFIAEDFLNVNLTNLQNYCYTLKSNSQGRVLSNYGGWQSNNLNHNVPELIDLTNELIVRVNKLLAEFSIIDNAYIENLWVNINQKNNFNKPHDHPNSVFSGVFYVSAPPDCGKIIFKNPNPLVRHYLNSKVIKQLNHLTANDWWFQPKDGMLLIFPSWLEHFVLPNESSEDRISIAFNTKIYE